MTMKSSGDDFKGRFREILADPLNILIKRAPNAGVIDSDGYVTLHNNIRVPIIGPNRYYGDFSDILIFNRGVHEPLEEFVFQEVLKYQLESPVMLELGAYWGHYSMWMKKEIPSSRVYLVEPEVLNMHIGMQNFKENNLIGTFVNEFVGRGYFSVDNYFKREALERIDILHADIQGYELEMLDGCVGAMTNRLIDYIFISTHSQDLHTSAVNMIQDLGYRIEVSSDFQYQTTSYDGFILASSPLKQKIFCDFRPIGRLEIINSSCEQIINYLCKTTASCLGSNDWTVPDEK